MKRKLFKFELNWYEIIVNTDKWIKVEQTVELLRKILISNSWFKLTLNLKESNIDALLKQSNIIKENNNNTTNNNDQFIHW